MRGLTWDIKESMRSFERKAARRRWTNASTMEEMTATHRGSGIIVLIANIKMNIGMRESPGLLGAEIWVDKKMAADNDEITSKLKATAKLRLWNNGNCATRNIIKRMDRVVIKMETSSVVLTTVCLKEEDVYSYH